MDGQPKRLCTHEPFHSSLKHAQNARGSNKRTRKEPGIKNPLASLVCVDLCVVGHFVVKILVSTNKIDRIDRVIDLTELIEN